MISILILANKQYSQQNFFVLIFFFSFFSLGQISISILRTKINSTLEYSLGMLPNSGPCTQYFPKQNSELSGSGAKNGLLIQKEPTKTTGDLEMPPIHLGHWTESGVCKQQKGPGRGVRVNFHASSLEDADLEMPLMVTHVRVVSVLILFCKANLQIMVS